jgi:hypothetical protein
MDYKNKYINGGSLSLILHNKEENTLVNRYVTYPNCDKYEGRGASYDGEWKNGKREV